MNQYAMVGGRRTRLALAESVIGRGGEAQVFRALNLPGQAAKIYNDALNESHASRDKLEAMILAPPENATGHAHGHTLSLFAWPTVVIEREDGVCSGFLMPEIPLDRAVSLLAFMSLDDRDRLLSSEDSSLPRRLQVCRNLAAVVAEIHRQRHYVVDIKPQNIYLFKDTGIVCLVDNDSFAIAGCDGRRFPASAYSSEYIAPELLANGRPASSVDDDRQDCFALAVLMFRLLDNGLHPFQGRPTREVNEWNIDLCVEKGFYPHGREPHPAIKPAPSSTSDLWDPLTMAMFDRAFAGVPSSRPGAIEWRDHFDRLQQSDGLFVKCARKPTSVMHIHFAHLGCPECRLESLDAVEPPSPPPPEPEPGPGPISGTPPPAPKKNYAWAYVLAGIVGIGVIASHNENSPAPAPVPDRDVDPSPRPAPVPEPAPPPLVTPPAVDPPAPEPPAPAPEPPAPAPAPEPAPVPAPAPDPAPEPPPAPAPEPAAPPQPPTDDASLARTMSDAGQTDALKARKRILVATISQVAGRQADDVLTVLRAGWAGSDPQTLVAAQMLLRQVQWVQHYDGWTRFRTNARALNAQALAVGSDLARAESLESEALALDPYDREIAGNLGYFLALKGNAIWANRLAVYSLSLPRGPADPGRGADWQLLGSSYAKLRNFPNSMAAYDVALAVTPNISGLCASLLQQQAQLGAELKAPIDVLFQRIRQRGQDAAVGCAYPPRWRE